MHALAPRWILALCLLAQAGCGLLSQEPLPPAVGNPAPPIEGVQLGGAPFSLAALRGRPVVLVFWASWCGPCRREVPSLSALAEDYGDQIALIGINAGEDPPTAAQAAAAWGLSWPVVFDPDGRTQADYEVDALPLVLILDRDGKIQARGFGLPEDTRALLDELLRP